MTGPPPQGAVYGASKAAVDAITKALAKELGPKKIRVNSVNPGMIVTEGVKTAGLLESEFRKTVEAETPLGRIGRPEDVASVVAFMVSDDAAWVTGEQLYVSGGHHN